MKRSRTADVAAIAAGLALFVLLVALRTSTRAPASFPSSYDTGRNGYAALYDLLGSEHLAVSRFELPIGQLPDSHTALVIAGDFALGTIAASPAALKTLDGWVRAGGALYIFGATRFTDRQTLGIPAPKSIQVALTAQTACGMPARLRPLPVAGDFSQGYALGCTRTRAAVLRVDDAAPAIAYRRGRGTIVLMSTPSVLDNGHLAERQNARFAYALFAGAGPVAFDERAYGYAIGRTFWEVLPAAVRWAIVLAGLAVLLALIGSNLPFAPPFAPATAEERDSGAYIASLAQMLQRAGAANDIVARLTAQCETLIRSHAATDERSVSLLARARALRETLHANSGDVMAAGELYAAVRKDYDW